MASTLISLLPLIIGSAVVPIQIVLVLLMLTSEEQPVSKALGFVGGMTAVRIVQGILFGFIFRGSANASEGSDGSGWVVSTLLTVLGILLLTTAWRSWSGEEDPDAPPPKWLTMTDHMSPLTAIGLGAGLVLISPKMWVFTLGAIGEIGDAVLGQPASTLAYLLFVLLAQSLLLIPIVVRLLVPDRSDALLTATSDWLEKYNKAIVIAVSLVFGLFFLYGGISGFFQSNPERVSTGT